jgi:hypothetical protein
MKQIVVLVVGLLGVLGAPGFSQTFPDPERLQFVPWKWVTLWGPDAGGSQLIKGRYGVGSYLLLQDANRINQEHIITERNNGDVKWRKSIYATPTLDIDDQPLFRVTCQEEEVVVERAVVDTIYHRVGGFKPTDERLDDYRGSQVYRLHQEGKEVVVYERRLNYTGYHIVSVIIVGSEGNVLTFYDGAAAKERGADNWSVRVTKTGMSTKESGEGTLMEVPTVRVERKGGDLRGLSEESFVIDTVLRYGRRSGLEAISQVTEATVDTAGNPTYSQQMVFGDLTKIIYRLGNFQVNFYAGG